MTDRRKISKAEEKVWKLLGKLYNKGYLSSLGYESGVYRFAFRHNKLYKPEKKIKGV